ncbi:MAG: hypothetical protein LUE92_01915 [Clostridiales bacterium]|nr:hypothetical protein [Clostridiales bacterium]
MFNKKKGNLGSKNIEDYVPAYLPRNAEDGHADLTTFIVEDYCVLKEDFLRERYTECENKLTPLIQISDQYTVGDIMDTYVDAEMEFVKNKYHEEVAFHELSGNNIMKARIIRMQELKKRMETIDEECVKRQKRIDELADHHAKYAIRIGRWMIQLGLPITVLALVADYYVNTQFIQNILYGNMNMLRILVICLCLMSDGTMYALGSLLSTNSKRTLMFRTFVFVFAFLFSISVVGSLAIRLGSMGLTYGNFNAAGDFIGKDTYTVAEYSLAIISGLATAVTGTMSFFFSYDEGYRIEKECRMLKTEQKRDEKVYTQLEAELTSLENAVDPLICDGKLQIVAEKNIEALKKGLKLYVRHLLALHQQDASYLNSMSESAKSLLKTNFGEEAKAASEDKVEKMMKTMISCEGRELKEAV